MSDIFWSRHQAARGVFVREKTFNLWLELIHLTCRLPKKLFVQPIVPQLTLLDYNTMKPNTHELQHEVLNAIQFPEYHL